MPQRPSRDCEHFEDECWKCMEVIEHAHEWMKLDLPKEDLEKRWLDEESEDCLFHKEDIKSWKDMRKWLWLHYVSEEVDKQYTAATDGCHCWDSEED